MFCVYALVRPFLALLSFCLAIITQCHEYLSTVDGTFWNCSRSPVLIIIFAACTAIDELQRMRLVSMYGCLPAHIRFLSSIQSLHSSRMCRTVCGPYPHWQSPVSALLIEWRYARRLILPVRICVITELIALCVPMCVVSLSFPGQTPSLKSSLPCLAFSQDRSYSPFKDCRIVVFVVAISACNDSGSGGGSRTVRVSGS